MNGRTPTREPGRILTVTVNPALDVSMSIDHLVPDRKLRAHDCRREAGGGGVNVSRALQRLGGKSTTVVVVGGVIGSELVAKMRAEGLQVSDVTIPGTTRESFAVTEATTDRQYRISVDGPTIEDPTALRRRVVKMAGDARIVVLSGSLAPGLPADFYAQIVADLDPDTTTIVDAHGSALAAVAAGTATIIKPSQRELAELVGWEPTTAGDIERAVDQVLDRGAVRAVVASRGPSGALLALRGSAPVWFRPPVVHPVSTIGAGDSMVAALALSLGGGSDIADAVRSGVAAGTAAVLTPGSQLCEFADVERIVDEVIVTVGRGRAAG